MSKFQKQIADAIAGNADTVRKLSDSIHDNPELGFNEFHAAASQIAILKAAGFSVENPVGSMSTAFKAESGGGSPVFCLISEYDALPELGHACGHNLIAATAVAAGLAVREIMEREAIPGRLVVMGTPCEETNGGKVIMLKENAFAGIDACVMTHPFYATGRDPGNLAVSRYDVIFTGKAAHAASEPEAGINALDAMNLLFCGINAWRQQLPGSSRIHGIITEGGVAPNIIPDKTSGFFYLRAVSNSILAAMEKRFNDIAHGAALMTGCEYQVVQTTHPYDANIPNEPLNAFVMQAATQLDMCPENITQKISTDFANLSRKIPGVSFFFKAAREHLSLHSKEFEQAAGESFAFEQAMLAAQILACTALEYFTDETFRQAVNADFKQHSGE